MRLIGTREVMAALRERVRLVRPNNRAVNEWVDDYIDNCSLKGEPVTILTQWCISKNLEARYALEGRKFVPTKKERLIFEKEIPAIAALFREKGLRINWWITFNRAYLDSRRIDRSLENEYKRLIEELGTPFVREGWLVFDDWEDDILCSRPKPNQEVLASIGRFVSPEGLALEMRWNSAWAEEETNLQQSEEKLKRDVCYQIACEAEEGRLLDGKDSPFGEFILMPLEVPEQYEFFGIFAKNFKKRIVAALSPYPWRLKENR